MTVIRFSVQTDDPAAVAAEIERSLAALGAVEEVQAEPCEPMALAEVAIAVAGIVAVTRGGRDIAVSVRETLDELKRIVDSWRDLKRTLFVEVDGSPVDVREVGEAEIERLAEPPV